MCVLTDDQNDCNQNSPYYIQKLKVIFNDNMVVFNSELLILFNAQCIHRVIDSLSIVLSRNIFDFAFQ